MDSGSMVPDLPLITPYPHLESDHHLFTPEKSLGRPGDGRVVPTSPVHMHRLEDSLVEAAIPSSYGVEQSSVPRYEADGGVRMVGGRVGEVVAVNSDQLSTSEGSTLPPPYSSHFGAI